MNSDRGAKSYEIHEANGRREEKEEEEQQQEEKEEKLTLQGDKLLAVEGSKERAGGT